MGSQADHRKIAMDLYPYEIPVNNYPNQVQNFEFMGYNLQLTLLWNAVGLSWSFDLYNNIQGEYIVQGEGLSIGMASLFYSDLPFVLMISDNSGLGFETISIDEMGDRLSLNIMSKEAYQYAIRQTIDFDGWQPISSYSDRI